MCPDSSGNLVSLLYLAKLEDIVAAKNYSWGGAVLAFLYRELCNASEKGKAAIGGALQLVQIWAWSRIIPLCPGLGDFNPQLWRSICPLIFYAIVEMHHVERVLRQFGMMQNIPDQPDTRDMSLHKIPFQSRVESGYQPGDAPVLQIVTQQINTLQILFQSKPVDVEGYRQLVAQLEHEVQIIAEAITHQPQQIATPSDTAPTTSHRQMRSSSQMCIGSVERGDIGVDIATPSTAYTPQDYYVPQPP
ncbi:UNVERIFIED_CONTAM: protein MAINTENANCE OF MERISTEMS [Sesamum angustifolium]|uniref:Protein MAINTENANCE OF MERISTEMS n=1 Tax=Sesamum angustifolium TaxID=2727405 RepID=A0AAW2LW38_9LAMI